jgi:hypothetical protein
MWKSILELPSPEWVTSKMVPGRAERDIGRIVWIRVRMTATSLPTRLLG